MLFLFFTVICYPALLDDLRHSPSVVEEIAHGNVLKTGFSCHIVCVRLLASNYFNPNVSTIFRLLVSGSPAAIARTICAVYILSFERQIGTWPFTNISQEVQKPVWAKPVVAHDYAATSIILVGPITLVVTPALSGAPSRVFWCMAHAMSLLKSLNHLQTETAATLRSSASPVRASSSCHKKCSLNHPHVSAIASAFPLNTITWDSLDNNQPAKSLPSQIFENSHCNSS